MMKKNKVADLCSGLDQKLVELHYSDDSMRRYRKVFREFTEYADGCDYSQSKGTDFLVWKFQQIGGFVTGGEHSKNGMYYFRAIRSLTEYYNFGILFRRNEFHGEIVWPEPFKEATEGFLRYEVEYGCSHWQYERCKAVIKDIILFLDSASVHDFNGITSGLISRFIATNLLQNNVDISTISDILGHSDPQVAQYYLRVDMKGLSNCAMEVEVMDYVKE